MLHYIYCYIQSIQSKYVLDQDHFCEIQKIIFHDLILFLYIYYLFLHAQFKW